MQIPAPGGASSGDGPEGGAGSGVLRLRLVTADSGGPGHRPPGMTTWLRGARCTDPEAMPEMEARPPAENRHGGAPRGERPASWDAPHPAEVRSGRASPARQQNIVRLSALRPPLDRGGRDHEDTTRAQQRAAGTREAAPESNRGRESANDGGTSELAKRTHVAQTQHCGRPITSLRSPAAHRRRCGALRWRRECRNTSPPEGGCPESARRCSRWSARL